MRFLVIGIGIIAALVVIVVVVGLILPRDHVASVSARIAATPADVWATLTEPAQFPSWRQELTKVELLPPTPTGPSWREYSRHGAITMVVDAADPPRKLVGRIADKDLPFGGTWTYEIAPEGEGASRVTITEAGSVYNPVFRFASRFIMGHAATMDAYLRALGRRYGAEPTTTIVSGS